MMKSEARAVGRKTLVPALSREMKCPHSYNDDEELSLDVECEGCPGSQDLSNDRCLTGILQILASEAEPEVLMLKRYIHRRYRESRLAPVLAAASELAALNRALSTRPEPSDGRCLTCPASMHRLADGLRNELLERPVEFMNDRSRAIDNIKKGLGGVKCARARACVAAVLEDGFVGGV
ncbi:MAG: hypothetical protein JSU93_05120 [Methanobacteriota archaeon]|nr:MAG: hypothetical protein JSU93_05120 [Euryarchaeota archaeon]